MTHPWTTCGGTLPLPLLKLQLSPPEVIRATRVQAMEAIDHSPLASLIRARLKEKTYQAGEYLFR